MQVAGRGLLARAFGQPQREGLLARLGQFRAPFPVPPIEHQHGHARLHAQHIDEVVRLVALERNHRAGGKRHLDKQPDGTEIVARHRSRLPK